MNERPLLDQKAIHDLYPEMIRRTEAVRGLLARMMAGEDIPWHTFDLARRDLLAVLDALCPPEDDDVWEDE